MRRTAMMDSKVVEYMYYRTANSVLIENAMNIAASLIGFGSVLGEDAEEKDRVFIQKLLKLPNYTIANCPKLVQYHETMRDRIVELIVNVKQDLKFSSV